MAVACLTIVKQKAEKLKAEIGNQESLTLDLDPLSAFQFSAFQLFGPWTLDLSGRREPACGIGN
jgi:hypothetical protein